jgi:RNA polymerase sigma factor (sigma-70 family)
VPQKSLPQRGTPRTASLLALAGENPTAFAAFYQAYASRVLVYFARRVFDPEVAADLTGETFALAYERRRQFRGSNGHQEQGWLFTIARHQLSQYWRKGQVERRALERLGLESPPAPRDDLELLEGVAAMENQRARVAAALGRLPIDQRRAVEARIVYERPYAQIAQEYGVHEQVIRARVSRGLKTLQRHLKYLVREEAL